MSKPNITHSVMRTACFRQTTEYLQLRSINIPRVIENQSLVLIKDERRGKWYSPINFYLELFSSKRYIGYRNGLPFVIHGFSLRHVHILIRLTVDHFVLALVHV